MVGENENSLPSDNVLSWVKWVNTCFMQIRLHHSKIGKVRLGMNFYREEWLRREYLFFSSNMFCHVVS